MRSASAAILTIVCMASALMGPAYGAVPKHVRTYLYYGAAGTNMDVPGALMARKATFIETSGGNADLVRAFKAAGGTYAIAYLDPTLVPYCKPPFRPPAGACAGPIGRDVNARESAWLHAADGLRLHRADAYTHEYQDVLDPASSATRDAFAHYTSQLLREAPIDGFFSDDTGSEMNGVFDGFGGASRELHGPQAWLDAERGLIAAAVRPLILNGSADDWGPSYGGELARSPNVLGVNFEGCFSSADVGIMGARYNYWTHMQDALLKDNRLGRYVVCMMTGPFSPPQRLYVMASWWLTYDARVSVAAPITRAPDGHAGYPEYDIVPQAPLETASANISDLKDASVYVRRFARCYQNGRAIGGCAAVVNIQNTAVSLPANLRGYRKTLQVDNRSEFANGHATWQSGVSPILAAAQGEIIAQ